MSSPSVRVTCIGVQNATRSQMATAFAAQEGRDRGSENEVEQEVTGRV